MLTPDQLTGKQKEAYEAQARLAKNIFPPGMHNISNADYHASMGLSKSSLMLFKKSARKYWHKYLKPGAQQNKKKKSFELGNAVHTCLLEPKEYKKNYTILPKFSGEGSKAKKDEFIKKHNGKILIREIDHQLVKAVISELNEHPTASYIFKDSNLQVEKSFFWIDPETGLMVKSRPDVLADDWVIELKTTANAEENAFSRDIDRYGYHIQSAMIIEGQKQLFNKTINRYVFVVCETEEPYITEAYALKDESIAKGLEIYKNTLFKAQECFLNDDWYGESKQIRWISIPTYAF